MTEKGATDSFITLLSLGADGEIDPKLPLPVGEAFSFSGEFYASLFRIFKLRVWVIAIC